MSEQRNLILAVVLSAGILFAWQAFFAPEIVPPAEQQQTTDADGNVIPAPAGTVPGTISAPAVPVDLAAARQNALTQSERVTIDTPRLKGSIALTGGRLDDLSLLDYNETLAEDSKVITLLSPSGTQNPYFVDIGWSAAPDQNLKLPNASTVWTVKDNNVLKPGQPVTLTWDNGQGLSFERRIDLDANFMFTVTQTVHNATDKPATLSPYGLTRRIGTPVTEGIYILHEGMLGVFGEALTELDYDDIADETGGVVVDKTTGGWIGITDKYWLAALIPDQSANFTGTFRHQLVDTKDQYQVDYLRAAVTIPANGSGAVTNRVFAGAKEVEKIDGYAEALNITRFDLAIDWGWLHFITKPLFSALHYIFLSVGNFGVAIILLTLAIKFLFLPLAYKSYVSMSAMKLLQPEIQALRERVGDDRAKLNQEMMALYKKHKVNPVSGCLPILLQIPVFFALYKVLYVTIEMRHAPFFGWIQDLSAPDPTTMFNLFGLIPWDPPSFLMIGVWPLLMGISMWAQQKLNPQPPDPTQAKIMMMLPLVFTFMLASFPAGLVIYWTANNVLSIGQQWFIMRRAANRQTAKA